MDYLLSDILPQQIRNVLTQWCKNHNIVLRKYPFTYNKVVNESELQMLITELQKDLNTRYLMDTILHKAIDSIKLFLAMSDRPSITQYTPSRKVFKSKLARQSVNAFCFKTGFSLINLNTIPRLKGFDENKAIELIKRLDIYLAKKQFRGA